MDLSLVIHRPNGKVDTGAGDLPDRYAGRGGYYRHGGILHYVLRGMAKAA